MLATHTIPSQSGKTSAREKNTETKKKLKLKIISSSNTVVSEKVEPHSTVHVVECQDTLVDDHDNNAGPDYWAARIACVPYINPTATITMCPNANLSKMFTSWALLNNKASEVWIMRNGSVRCK